VFLRIKRQLGRISVAAATAAGTYLAAGTAHAQSGTFYLDRAQISGAPDDGFMVWRPYLAEKTRFYATGILGYSHNPLRSDPVTTVIDSCVGCGLCGEVADAAVLCPSFYKADIVQNATWWDRLLWRVRSAVIGAMASG